MSEWCLQKWAFLKRLEHSGVTLFGEVGTIFSTDWAPELTLQFLSMPEFMRDRCYIYIPYLNCSLWTFVVIWSRKFANCILEGKIRLGGVWKCGSVSTAKSEAIRRPSPWKLHFGLNNNHSTLLTVIQSVYSHLNFLVTDVIITARIGLSKDVHYFMPLIM